VYRRQRDGDKLVNVEPAKFGTYQWQARLLLLQPDCLARSWHEVRTVDVIEYETFADATKALGLLDNHKAAVATIAKCLSSRLHTPLRARVLFLLVRYLFLYPLNFEISKMLMLQSTLIARQLSTHECSDVKIHFQIIKHCTCNPPDLLATFL
jgi:hypothetical protein